MANISTQIEEIEFILRYFEQKSLKPEEVQIVVDRQIKPIEFILNSPDEKKNGNEFDQAIYIFRSNALNQCSRIKNIKCSRYNGNKYQKNKSEILYEINQIELIAEYVLNKVINSSKSKNVSVLVESLVWILYNVFVLVLVKVLDNESGFDFQRWEKE